VTRQASKSSLGNLRHLTSSYSQVSIRCYYRNCDFYMKSDVFTHMTTLFEDDPYHRLMQLVGALHAKARQFTERRLRPLGMTYPQLAALMALHHEDGVTQTELAASMETDTTTVMVLCDSLEKKGWVKRTPDGSDRRVNRLLLTEAGRRAYSEARQRLRPEDECMAAKIPPEELKRTIARLETLHKAIAELLRTG